MDFSPAGGSCILCWIWKFEDGSIFTNNYISTRGQKGHMLKLEVGSLIFFLSECHHWTCRFGSWKLEFLSVSPLNICWFGSWKLEFVSVTIEHVLIWKLDFCQCHHWTYVDLEVVSCNLSVSPLNMCRFGSWKL